MMVRESDCVACSDHDMDTDEGGVVLTDLCVFLH